jgi:CheY-like chemotaxis protein
MSKHDSGFPILIVDDDEGHIELVRRNLRRIAVSNPILALSDGARALDYIFRRHEFADTVEEDPVILLDINMPGSVNGMEVLRQIKTDPATRKIPVIMLSTTDDPREVSRCYELGCSVYITKPVDSMEFIKAIRCLGCFFQIIRVSPAEVRIGEAQAT